MYRVFLLISLSVAICYAFNMQRITCHSNFGEWDCWYNQTCGKDYYVCNGEANDAPPFTPLAFTWIIIGSILAFVVLAVLVGLVVCCCFMKKTLKCCC